MTDKPVDLTKRQGGELIHLGNPRKRSSLREGIAHDVELSIAGHFREQNEILREMNKGLSDKVQRITAGVERLVEEMQGVRTGKKDEAFARVAPCGADPDLPTVSADAALIYTLTATDIGAELGFAASQIGQLLGTSGLRWAGDGSYQEIGRHKKEGQMKYWHRDLPTKLRKVLDENLPPGYGITNKSVLAIFRRWQQRQKSLAVLNALEPTETPH